MSKENQQQTIKKVQLQQIQEIIDSGRPFDNIEQFIDRALQIYITWEKAPADTFALFKTFPFTTEQQEFMNQIMQPQVLEEEFAEVSGKSESLQRQQKLRDVENLPDVRKYYKETREWIKDNFSEKKYTDTYYKRKEDMLIEYDGYPLIYRFYSRILPAKIAIITLANIMRETEKLEVELEEFQEKAFDIAEELAKEIEEYEDEYNLKRNKRISTGLPKFIESGDERYIVEKRFKGQYLGNKRNSNDVVSLDGALSALGLIKAVTRGKKTFVTFTDLGSEFYQLESPVLKGDYSKAFSSLESAFIIKRIFPQRELENELIKKSLEIIKKNEDDREITIKLDKIFRDTIENYVKEKKPFSDKLAPFPKQHDEICKDIEDGTSGSKQSRIMAYRVATMGRLSETGIINWEIGKQGKSIFSINNESRLGKFDEVYDEKLSSKLKNQEKEIIN